VLTVTLSSTTTAGGQMRRMPTDQRGGDLTPPLADTLHEMSCDQFHDGLCGTPSQTGLPGLGGLRWWKRSASV
jgi:hypothetical protein